MAEGDTDWCLLDGAGELLEGSWDGAIAGCFVVMYIIDMDMDMERDISICKLFSNSRSLVYDKQEMMDMDVNKGTGRVFAALRHLYTQQ